MNLSELLVTHRRDLARFLQHQAGWLLRFEAADDLLQGLHVRVLQQAQNFEYRGREPFLAQLVGEIAGTGTVAIDPGMGHDQRPLTYGQHVSHYRR